MSRILPKPNLKILFVWFRTFIIRNWCFVFPLYAAVTPALRGPRREPACIDGWMGDGWMDGLVSTWFFSAYFSKTTLYMTLIVSMPPRRRFKTSFVKKSEFLKNLNFLKKFRTKRVFFEKIHQKEFRVFLIKKNSNFFD